MGLVAPVAVVGIVCVICTYQRSVRKGRSLRLWFITAVVVYIGIYRYIGMP